MDSRIFSTILYYICCQNALTVASLLYSWPCTVSSPSRSRRKNIYNGIAIGKLELLVKNLVALIMLMPTKKSMDNVTVCTVYNYSSTSSSYMSRLKYGTNKKFIGHYLRKDHKCNVCWYLCSDQAHKSASGINMQQSIMYMQLWNAIFGHFIWHFYIANSEFIYVYLVCIL